MSHATKPAPHPGGRAGSPTAPAPIPAAAAIRPAGPADLAALGDFFAGLSARTRYLRFFGPVALTPALLRVLSGGGASVDAVVAVRDGAIIGHAMAAGRPGTEGTRRPGAVRGPHEPAVTDIGVVVADDWQGRGVGSALVRALVDRAQARGVTSLAMDVLYANHRVLSMVERRWPAADIDRFREGVTIHVRLPRSEQLPSASPRAPRRCGPGRMRSHPESAPGAEAGAGRARAADRDPRSPRCGVR